ncbi:MAG TPA: aromatic amino acid ammonia-lyase [Myxococcota bacterium]|nr:aromatic amino acid ammonia-lyase [Myxococcota bacterium]
MRLTGRDLSTADVVAVALGARVELAEEARAAMSASVAAFADAPNVLDQKRSYLLGDVRPGAEGLARSFILGHCAGVGEPLPVPYVRAMILCRANVLAHGASGVRPELVDALCALLNAGITPVVPSQGSVGAAGDLAPLAHVARVLCGLGGAVIIDGERHSSSPLPAFDPTPKEALSLINGATLTVALAAVALEQAETLLLALESACAMSLEALRADLRCLSASAQQHRGQPGAIATAERLRGLLEGSELWEEHRPPDAFSLRAAPAVIGAAWDAWAHCKEVVSRELNGACDNPLWFSEEEGIVEAGNFHGAPVALAMDYLRIALTQAATQSERRSFRLTHGSINRELPSFLVEGTGLNSGFMLAQYTAASLASECKGLCHPAVVDTIPTMQHQEDHVSMGPIAGRLCLRVLECVADIVGIEALLSAQALDFRREGWHFQNRQRLLGHPARLGHGTEQRRSTVREATPFWHDDQILHPALRAVGGLVREGKLGGKSGWLGPA